VDLLELCMQVAKGVAIRVDLPQLPFRVLDAKEVTVLPEEIEWSGRGGSIRCHRDRAAIGHAHERCVPGSPGTNHLQPGFAIGGD
jgi:hypothetical protein